MTLSSDHHQSTYQFNWTIDELISVDVHSISSHQQIAVKSKLKHHLNYHIDSIDHIDLLNLRAWNHHYAIQTLQILLQLCLLSEQKSN